VILRSGMGPTAPSSPGSAKIVCKDVPAPTWIGLWQRRERICQACCKTSWPRRGRAERSWSWLGGAASTSPGGAKRTWWNQAAGSSPTGPGQPRVQAELLPGMVVFDFIAAAVHPRSGGTLLRREFPVNRGERAPDAAMATEVSEARR
jgi:hypothetical protein